MSGLLNTSIMHGLLFLIRSGLILGLAAYCTYASLSVWAARQWHRARQALDPEWTPAVTILKPVCGVDAHAYDNYASFCRLDYPRDQLQLIFGALDPDDSALAIVRQLQQDFPLHDITIVTPFTPTPPRGQNLKVSNLLCMLPAAKHDLLVMCDSDVRVQPHYLREVVAPFQKADPPVGLVTCPYRGLLPQSLAAHLEALDMGADFIPSALVGRAVEGMSFAFGSTMAMPRRVLDEIGGFEAILDYLADDYLLGYKTKQAGYEVVMSNHIVEDVLGVEKFGLMWRRRLRWARTVRACRPRGYAGAFVTHGTLLALLFWVAMGCGMIGTGALCGILLLRLSVSIWIARAYTHDPNLRQNWPLLPLSDLLGSALFLASFGGNRITWRGQRFLLHTGGKIERLN